MACIRTEEPQWEAGSAPHSTPNKTGQKNIIQIYTDWANHYLDKGKCKRHIQSLQNDVVDGVIISDVIEAVTGQKVADVNRRPKTRAQMVQNLDLCLAHLRSMGVVVDDVQSDDVIDGKLKPILGLFFQLSRHKQAQQGQKRKPRAEPSAQHASSKVPGGGKSGISCIPSARDRQPVDKTKQSLLQKPSSAASSRSTSPTSVSGSRSRLAAGQRSGLSTPRMGRAATAKAASSLAGPAAKTPQTKSGAVSAAGLAATKDKGRSRAGGNVIKRTSSSSGFSSARSEKSDSSSNVNTADSSSTGTPSSESVGAAAAPARPTPDSYGSLSRRGGQRSLLQAPQQRAGRPTTATAASPAGAKRRSLAGSQSSLASSCGGQAPASAIPKPSAAATAPAASTASPAPAATQASTATPAPAHTPVPASPAPAAAASSAPSPASRGHEPEEKVLVLPRQRQLGRGRPAPAVSVALVSPMPQTPEPERTAGGGGGGHPASRGTTEQQSRRGTKEAVTEPPSDVKPSPAPVAPEKAAQEQEQESTEDVYSLRPMQPILRLSQYGFGRGGMGLTGRRQHNQHSYGYMSDTDGVSEDPRYDAVMDGYMSEDGLYARSHAQVKYSSLPLGGHRARTGGGEETGLWRVETPPQQQGAAMASDRSAYYSYTDSPGSQYIKKSAHASDQNRFAKKEQPPEFKQISNTQWKRAVEGRRPPGEQLTAPSSPATDPRHSREQRERSQTPVGKHKRENGTSTPEPSASAAAAAAESPNLKFSRQKLRKSAASYAKRPTSQTSVSSAGSAGLPPKDPEHRPRTKVKVSGSTQTTSELLGGEQELATQQRRLQQLKSYSLTGPAAQQLSQSVRERILAGGGGGGGGGGGEQSFSTLPASGQRPRPAKVSDGSLSDSNYSPYGDPRRHPAQRPSSAYTTYVGQQLAKTFRGSMTEAESMESVSSGASGLLAQLHQQRSGSLTQNRLINYGQWEGGQGGQSPRLSRSNSIRSTKSEKLYSNLLQRGGSAEEEPYYSALVAAGRAEPPSPTPSPSRASFPLSPGTARSSYGARSSKDDDAHGSSLSLVSTTSSIYSAQEEKQASEYRRLKRDMLESQEKVQTLTNQLTTNAHVVEAFEQSLTSMTKKLHQITLSSEQKDKDMGEMRKQMDRLQRALAASGGSPAAPLTRQTSNESISSMSSACSAHSQQSSRTPDSPGSKKKKKKGWLRSSFGKAFSRRKPKTGSDMEDGSAPSSPVMASRHSASPAGAEHADTPSRDAGLPPSGPVEEDLRRQLREKDTALTDMRLEALSSHHQLETLKETVSRVRKEMACMRQDNERLQRLVASRSANSSRSSLAAEPGERPPTVPSPSAETAPRLTDQTGTGAATREQKVSRDQKVLTASVRLGDEDCPIGTVTVARKTGWETLDDAICGAFKDYLCRLDPDQSLGIDADSITGYRLGEVWRGLADGDDPPELMPWGYTIGDVRQAQLELRGHDAGCVDAFVFETLIPKPIVHRYVSILVEHRRVILCGQSGTGKTYLARRLAEYLVRRSGAAPSPQTVATVTVEPGGGRELHQYLGQLSERCRQPDAALPHCLILDNLHHVQALADVFNGFLSTTHTDPRCPYIIGTLSQPGASTDLQLHHNFRWVLCANHVEPVRGFLGRHLRRRLAGAELASGTHDPQLRAVFEWVPRVWQQLNKFLETHSSADVTMGPRLLLNCPCDLTASQVWFTGVWNYSIVPYLVETVREGLLIYGRRASWHDPTQFVLDTYPWPRAAPHAGADSLTRLRREDVGYEAAAATSGQGAAPTQGGGAPPPPAHGSRRPLKDTDPLLSMLMSLQEAANYSPMSGRPSSAATSPDRPREPPSGRRTAGQATL